MQHRRVGGRIAEKIFAKEHGDDIVLYVISSRLFRRQDYDLRFTVAEAMWKLWSVKCLGHNVVVNPKKCHMVLIDKTKKNKIIGGSTVEDGSNIWIKR